MTSTQLPDNPQLQPRTALVTGATGYIGGRLVPQLLDAGFHVRVLSRHPDRLRDLSWFPDVEVFKGDAGEPDAVGCLAGTDVAYYLHSLQLGTASPKLSATSPGSSATARDVRVPGWSTSAV
jgi:uncharacterized protein YbjT (DUF2867 family)